VKDVPNNNHINVMMDHVDLILIIVQLYQDVTIQLNHIDANLVYVMLMQILVQLLI